MLGQVAPQADDIGDRPFGDEVAEAAVFLGDVEDQLGIARHAFQLAQMTNDPRILHQALQMIGAHQNDFFRIEAKEHLLEGWPFGVHQTVLQTCTKHPQGQGRQVTVVADGLELSGGGGRRQVRFQRGGGTKAVEAVFIEPFVVLHALSKTKFER